MDSEHTDQGAAAGQSPRAQDSALAGGAGRQGPRAAEHCELQAIAQAVRAVMHPELHEPEWRYVHGATQGADAVAAQG
jgi:hypothetical protein